MYISCQVRDGDMDAFFGHENQEAPPSLSNMGYLRQCIKSDVVKCFEMIAMAEDWYLACILR